MRWLAIFLLPLTLFAREPFFTVIDPPKGWLFTDPSKYDDGVKVVFIASNKKLFTPSLTLAVEYVGNASIAQYTKAIEKIYQRDDFQELGTFKTSTGMTHLFQIDKENQWGAIRILQAITLYEGFALIQTGSCLKKEFLEVHETYLKSFRSLRTTPSILTSCANNSLEKRLEEVVKSWRKLCLTSKDDKESLFTSSFFQNTQWKPFVNYIQNELESEGKCWQFLAIKHIQETLLSENPL